MSSSFPRGSILCMGSVASRPKIRSKSSQVAVEKCLWDGTSICKLSPKDLVVVKYTKKISDIFCEKSYRYILHYLVIAKYTQKFLDRFILYKKLHFTTSSDFFHSFGRIFSLILVESLLGSGNSVGLSG